MNSWIYSLILLQLTVVSWIDVRTKKISNLWFFFNLGLALAFHLLLPQYYPRSWTAVLFPVAWIVFGFILFSLGVMGAGDSKYLASLFLIIPLEHQAVMLQKIIISTIVVGSVLLSFKLFRNFSTIKAYALSSHWRGLKESFKDHFSYAPVVLLAWLILGVDQWI